LHRRRGILIDGSLKHPVSFFDLLPRLAPRGSCPIAKNASLFPMPFAGLLG
jgi:hypothetical protein